MIKISEKTYGLAAVLSIIILPITAMSLIFLKMFGNKSGKILFNTMEILKIGNNGYTFNIKTTFLLLVLAVFLATIVLSIIFNILLKGLRKNEV
ncbi:hypothetical protein K2F40_13050 [Clostridium sp. CM028]|uniref:hypothetical protein n=1 Tax=Clostridium TaxID=1485 RepID=UPI0013EED590|nr:MULTISPECIES: hypothetical protein [Clostridium]MBU3092391.1 hypothetical protein [Clostridium sp. CF011]MBW9146020.1 hypothetical protein [Clostridium sp. CM027]MBW9149886.1 hypothetical protein [Clostridium sp. CM028]MBZ9606695.1 hypothetical protein [Clostridium estertheticum]UVE39490.1 hypothetical protein KTC92_09510 [Clostridium sp. CM027]